MRDQPALPTFRICMGAHARAYYLQAQRACGHNWIDF